MKPYNDDGLAKIYQADVLTWVLDYKKRIDAGEVLPFHATVTDPPYGLSEPPPIEDVLTAWLAGDAYEHNKGGFMGKAWDNLPPGPQFWRALLDITYPGGYLFAFSGTRTADLLGIACRLGGWEPFDRIMHWTYGSGFPKSHNLSIALDKEAGAEREDTGPVVYAGGHVQNHGGGKQGYHEWNGEGVHCGTAPATPLAQAFDGYGSALKPAGEPILLFRKPREGRTFVQCASEFGSGGLDIGATRVKASGQDIEKMSGRSGGHDSYGPDDDNAVYGKGLGQPTGNIWQPDTTGRWPPNTHFSHIQGSPCPTCEGSGCDECHGHGVIGGCRRVGSKMVRGSHPSGSTGAGFNTQYIGGEPKKSDIAIVRHHDADGREEVADWECVEGCAVRALDENSTTNPPKNTKPVHVKASDYNASSYKAGTHEFTRNFYQDSSSNASRFYPNHDWSLEIAERLAGETPFKYQAKASRGERDAGLGDFPETTECLTSLKGIESVRRCPEHDASIPSGSNHYTCGCRIVKAGIRERQPQRNTGPCVKPLSLTKWLTALCCPPPQFSPRLCVPFAGTGSEAIGAILSGGWAEIHAIERELEYVEIAAARIAWWTKWAKLTAKTDPAEIRPLAEAAEAKEAWQDDERQRSMFEMIERGLE